MLFDILIFLAHVTPAYRASEDAGIWMLRFDMKQRQEYIESYLITKGLA